MKNHIQLPQTSACYWNKKVFYIPLDVQYIKFIEIDLISVDSFIIFWGNSWKLFKNGQSYSYDLTEKHLWPSLLTCLKDSPLILMQDLPYHREVFSIVSACSSKIWDEIQFYSPNKIDVTPPPLFGLLLGGGKSSRMGEDKLLLKYYGNQTEELRLLNLLTCFCEESFLSGGTKENSMTNLIQDTFLGLGPMSGILSAFQRFPSSALLVIACDMPLLDEETLSLLVKERDTSAMGTCFWNQARKNPEPLCAIYEPSSYPILLEYLSRGIVCPSLFFRKNEVKKIYVTDISSLWNANTPEERTFALEKIKKA